jgi:glycogen phosphorylase
MVKGEEAGLFHPLVEKLLGDDPLLLLADYRSYVDCQDQASALWADTKAWRRKSILNVARMGRFSCDRSTREYCEHVWNAKALSVEVERGRLVIVDW